MAQKIRCTHVITFILPNINNKSREIKEVYALTELQLNILLTLMSDMKIQIDSASQAHKKSCFERQKIYLRMVTFHKQACEQTMALLPNLPAAMSYSNKEKMNPRNQQLDQNISQL